jgi:cytosine/adenosine deaminase-related metal-dependent hydrolase
MKYFSADYILPISSGPIKDGVVVLDDQGCIDAIGLRSDYKSADIDHYEGILMPGMINTHCHLELSHMKGKCPTGTTLIPFITNVVKMRDFDQDVIQEKIIEEDKNMWDAGIQAVGDISNKLDTAEQKKRSPISYYTFVEMFDFMQSAATEATIEQYRNVYKDQAHESGNKRSFVPHAPYSVSEGLFDFINRANPDNATISIHNQETLDEELLFSDGSGRFPDFFKGFNVSLDGFTPLEKTSIHYALQHMTPKKKNIFVHNTLTNTEDIEAAHNWSSDVYWATCPNANLYIENRLPHYQNFLDSNAKMTIGTDSIMSNWQLSIWEEIKTIKKMQSYVPLTDLLTWATINGAEALGYQKSMGTIEVGKKAGLVHVDIEWRGDDTDISSSNAMRVY